MHHKVSEKYELLKGLGRGGYGTVYLAQHKQLGELKAIKELTPKTKTEKKRIEREVSILQQAQHPYVIKIDEVIESDQATYICMEYAQGGSLEEKIKTPLPIQESLGIIIDVLKGIQAFHAKGVIHRDIKPANILFDNTGKAKIGDFGIAKTSLNISKQLTQTGATLGTVGYMPPEQLLGKKDEIDEQVDVYATGIMLYEMLAGKHPFRGVNQLETVNRTLKGQYTVQLKDKKVDYELISICHRAINQNKSKRYTYASEMLEDLSTYYSNHKHKKSKSIQTTFYSKTLQQVLLGLTTGVLLTVIGSTILLKRTSPTTNWRKINKEYQYLLAQSNETNKQLFRLTSKAIQRDMYNELQQESEFNITEDILKGKELYTLGMIYYKGKGVEKNYKLAYQYFEQASKYNIVDAYLNLGDMTLKGEGIEIDQQKAIEYYEWVAKQNDPRGYHNLGEMRIKENIIDKKGVEYLEKSAAMNYDKSIERLVRIFIASDNQKNLVYYIKKGAELNNAFCLGILGESFIIGKYNFKKDDNKGLEYIKKAILYGNLNSIEFLLNYNRLNKSKQEKILQDLFRFINTQEIDKIGNRLVFLGYMYENGYGIKKNYEKAKELYEKAIELGNTNAMNNLGSMYQNGQWVEKDYIKAKKLYEKATELDDPDAINNLGSLYCNGYGVKKDYVKAKELYEKAIDLGNTNAMNNLGSVYCNGYGVKKDYVKAKELYEKAIELGNSNGMNNLGSLYLNGQGVEQNYTKAKELYEKAIELGNSNGMTNLGFLYFNGQGVKQNYTKAKELFEIAVELGNANAMNNLGSVYYNGYGVNQDYNKAIKLYEKAIKLGHADAMNKLGDMYYNGQGVEQNYTKAIFFFEKAVTLGNSNAINNLGSMYYSGHGVKKDYNKAKELFEKATELNNSSAINNLADMYYNGYGAQKDYNKAIKLYEKAITLGDVNAMNSLGSIYHNGQGVNQDYNKAIKLFEKAMKLGHTDAMTNLGSMYYNGYGLKKDYTKAKKLFDKAVTLGNTNAMYNLGVIYYNGHGTQQNHIKAKKLFKQAASMGNQNAINTLKIIK